MTQELLHGVGARIAKYRRMNEWSARELAERAGEGVSREIVANVESGRRRDLALSQFLAICIALEVPPVALLFDVERPFDLVDVPLTWRWNADGEGGTRGPIHMHEAYEWFGQGTIGDDALSPVSREYVHTVATWTKRYVTSKTRQAESAWVVEAEEAGMEFSEDQLLILDIQRRRRDAADQNLEEAARELRAMGVEVPDAWAP